VKGTPLGDRPPIDVLELVRTIATARILMPASRVRLSAGRIALSDEAQALCFMAGANSVFLGDRLLTTPNPHADRDRRLFDKLGLRLETLTESRRAGFSRPINARQASASLEKSGAEAPRGLKSTLRTDAVR
jgi:biotin synthase-like enzyme